MSTVERIKELIIKKGITAKAMLLELKLPHSAMTEWKNGKAKPSANALQKIATYFNVSVDYLLTGKENDYNEELGINNESLQYLEELKNRPESKIWFTLIKDVSKEELEKYVAVIEAMKGKRGNGL